MGLQRERDPAMKIAQTADVHVVVLKFLVPINTATLFLIYFI